MSKSVKVSSNLQKVLKTGGFEVNIKNAIEKALAQTALLVQNKAKELAPYDTGKLRQSITTNFNRIKQGKAIIWSPLPYARLRNYVNKRNPQTKFYLVSRSYDETKNNFSPIIKRALKVSLG